MAVRRRSLDRLRTFVFSRVVWRFLRNGDVMWMTLPHTRWRDLDESCFLAQLVDRSRTAITHAGPEAPHELIDERTQRSFEGHAPFDPFGDQFIRAAAAACLSVAFARPLDHRPERTHPAIDLKRSALVENLLPRAFRDAGEQSTDHPRRRSGGDRLRQISRITNSSIRD